MKKIVLVMALFALSFATGFTCSKNAPEQAAVQAPADSTAPQAEMAVSGDATSGTGQATTTPAK